MDEQEQSAETLNSDAAAAAAEDHDQQAAQHDDQADEVSQEDTEEDEEVEIGDKKFALPKSAAAQLKSERLMQQDYTRKTQEAAAELKTAKAEREENSRLAEQQQQYIKEVAKVTALDDQLEQYKQVDWNALSDQDPVGAQKLHFQYQALQQQREQATQALTQKQNDHALAEQQATAKQLQDAEAYVRREIPSWTPERTSQITAFAESQGIKMDPATVRVMFQNPALFKVLHKAEQMDQLEKKQSSKPKAPAAPPAPVTRVGASRATAAKDPAKMSDAEWARQRAERQRKR